VHDERSAKGHAHATNIQSLAVATAHRLVGP
jgi:hypothetical protein